MFKFIVVVLVALFSSVLNADVLVDQQQLIATNPLVEFNPYNPIRRVTQTFVPTVTEINQVKIYLDNVFLTDNVRVSIVKAAENNGDEPSNHQPIQTLAMKDSDPIVNGENTITFGQPVSLVPGARYGLRVYSDAGIFSVMGSRNNDYDQGNNLGYDGGKAIIREASGPWFFALADQDSDIAFKTLLETSEPSAALLLLLFPLLSRKIKPL
jgi:hypothetical protein